MPNLREIALGIKHWALANHMMGDKRIVPEVDMALVRSVFGKVGVPTAVNILQNRGISYVGINELLDQVLIFTDKKLNRREMDLFANLTVGAGGNDRVSIAFMESGIAQSGMPPTPPVGIPPLHEHNGYYTCGSSIYMGSEKGAGTLGCLVQDANGKIFGLSNNHITGGSNYAFVGLPIVAPGSADVAAGVRDPETIGHHARAYPFIDGIPEIVDAGNNLDAALFEVSKPERLSSMQRDRFDTPGNSGELEVGQTVEKVGRTTGYTKGTVISELFDYEYIVYHLDVIGGKKIIFFKSLFMIKGENQDKPFSTFGDSGSLIVSVDNDKNRVSVGIVVGATKEGLTLALSLNRILKYFGVQVLSGHNI